LWMLQAFPAEPCEIMKTSPPAEESARRDKCELAQLVPAA
jgi:hypothetical protein